MDSPFLCAPGMGDNYAVQVRYEIGYAEGYGCVFGSNGRKLEAVLRILSN